MDLECPFVRLGDLVDERGICYGVVQPGTDEPDGVPMLRVNNMTRSGLSLGQVFRIDREIEAKYVRSRLRGGEVLISLVGSLGLATVAPEDLAGWNVARAVGVVPVRREIGAEWVAYALQSPSLQHQLRVWATTTVQATLNLRELAELKIPLPAPEVRARIVSIIAALDDKIDLNRKMNRTLDDTAQAVYDSRFGAFERDSACLPSGWSVAALGSRTLPLVKPGLGERHGTLEYVATADVLGSDLVGSTIVDFRSRPGRANMRPGSGRVWFAKMKDSPKRLWTMHEHEDFWDSRILSTGFSGIEPTRPSHQSIVWCFVASSRFESRKNALATGTTMQALNNETIGRISLILPTDDVADEFDARVRPLALRRWACLFETQTLSSIRDALLPRLISGELRVSDIERVMEEVV